MSFCAKREAIARAKTRAAYAAWAGWGTLALQAHDHEHAWRSAGELAIREEMERRVAVWLARRLAGCVLRPGGFRELTPPDVVALWAHLPDQHSRGLATALGIPLGSVTGYLRQRGLSITILRQPAGAPSA